MVDDDSWSGYPQPKYLTQRHKAAKRLYFGRETELIFLLFVFFACPVKPFPGCFAWGVSMWGYEIGASEFEGNFLLFRTQKLAKRVLKILFGIIVSLLPACHGGCRELLIFPPLMARTGKRQVSFSTIWMNSMSMKERPAWSHSIMRYGMTRPVRRIEGSLNPLSIFAAKKYDRNIYGVSAGRYFRFLCLPAGKSGWQWIPIFL